MLNYLTRTYLILTFQFFLSLVFAVVSLLFPNWLLFQAPAPLNFRTKYGLFQQCSILTCRPFPDPDRGDCDPPDFCHFWYTARYSQLTAVLLGVLILFLLISVVFSAHIRQKQSWPLVFGLISLFNVLQIVAMACIANLLNNSGEFYIGTNYDFGFYLNLASWILALTASAQLVGSISLRQSDYQELQ